MWHRLRITAKRERGWLNGIHGVLYYMASVGSLGPEKRH